MTKSILPPTISLLETAYQAAEPTLPEEADELERIIESLNLPYADNERLWSAVFCLIGDVKESAFKAGWQMRSQL